MGITSVMKHALMIFIFSLLVFQPAFAQETPDKEKERLIGPVRSVSIIDCEKNKEGYSDILNTAYYDVKGNIIEAVGYDQNGVGRTTFVYSYDTQGRLKEKISYSNGAVYSREEYVYDHGGFAKKEYRFQGHVLKTKEIYNSDGNIIEKIYYDDDGVSSSKVLYINNNEGKIIEMRVFETNDAVTSKWRNVYDEKGNLTEDFSYSADGSLLGKHVYTYDDHGNYSGISSYRSGVLAGETIYKYEYDVNGNWIKRTTLDIGPVFTLCRSITYF